VIINHWKECDDDCTDHRRHWWCPPSTSQWRLSPPPSLARSLLHLHGLIPRRAHACQPQNIGAFSSNQTCPPPPFWWLIVVCFLLSYAFLSPLDCLKKGTVVVVLPCCCHPLFFWDSRRTYWATIWSMALTPEPICSHGSWDCESCGSMWYGKEACLLSTQSSTFFSFLFEDVLKWCSLLKIQKMGRGKQCPQGKGTQCGTATLSGPASQDFMEQIPDGMIG
jgi:hypothetical protein